MRSPSPDNDRLPETAIPAVKAVMNDIVEGRFHQLEVDGRSGRSRAEDLARVMQEYRDEFGDDLAPPPEIVYQRQAFTMCLRDDDMDDRWYVDIDFFYRDGEQSDLTASLTLTKMPNSYDVEINTVRVM